MDDRHRTHGHKRDRDDSQDNDGSPAAANDEGSSQQKKFKSFAERQMEKMGYVDGKGLGVSQDGITVPINESNQFGRRGLGFQSKGLKHEQVEDQEIEDVKVEQHPDWFPACTLPIPESLDIFDDWISIAQVSPEAHCTVNFTNDTNLPLQIAEAKTLLDDVDDRMFISSRNRANPFEAVKKEFFGTSRAAVKMANLDAVYDFMFTGNDKNATVYFADICAGPGGFTEYVLWRKRWRAKGFGLTLVGDLDFKIAKFNCESPYDTFFPYYGVDGRGDIYNSKTLRTFQEIVSEETKGKMLDFVSGDGGMDFTQDYNHQEITNQQLLLCQFLCGLLLLRKGGHFVCKTFELFTDFSAGLCYIMYLLFEQISIIKTPTSRQANSERYLVGKNYKKPNSALLQYLFKVNDTINSLKREGKSAVIGIVPIDVMQQSEEFAEYMSRMNDKLGGKQLYSLKKLHNYIRDQNLPGENQAEIRKQCLELWKLPDMPYYRPDRHRTPEEQVEDRVIVGEPPSPPPMSVHIQLLSQKHVVGPGAKMGCRRDWICQICVASFRVYVMSLPNRDVYVYNFQSRSWHYFKGAMLPPRTFLLAELITDPTGRRRDCLHVLDGMVLGGEDIRRMDFKTRHTLVSTFLQQLHRNTRVSHPLGRNMQASSTATVFTTKLFLFETEPMSEAFVLVSNGLSAYDHSFMGERYEPYEQMPVQGVSFFPIQAAGRNAEPVSFSFRSCLRDRVDFLQVSSSVPYTSQLLTVAQNQPHDRVTRADVDKILQI
eukprot:m.100277 g.100277  ORF g.100277 m.100277 type:complete len:768 (+) comp13696_c0_seq5:319-2622(+)